MFRHAYRYGLDDERVAFLLRRVLKKKDDLIEDLNRFRDSISSIMAS